MNIKHKYCETVAHSFIPPNMAIYTTKVQRKFNTYTRVSIYKKARVNTFTII